MAWEIHWTAVGVDADGNVLKGTDFSQEAETLETLA